MYFILKSISDHIIDDYSELKLCFKYFWSSGISGIMRSAHIIGNVFFIQRLPAFLFFSRFKRFLTCLEFFSTFFTFYGSNVVKQLPGYITTEQAQRPRRSD